MNLKKTSNFIIGALVFFVLGCSADPYNQGNYVSLSELKSKEGIWTRADVENTIGSPSFADPKNQSIVYYVGAVGVKYPFVSPSVEKSATICVEYDSQGTLIKVSAVE